jgi:ABC-type sugar transport system ATPase subunit
MPEYHQISVHTPQEAPLLEMQQIVKSFTGTVAVNKVDFICRKGEIHGLVGENGAGKSTLMKVMGGVYQPDSGKLLINGQVCRFKNYSDARRSGIGLVYQELSLLPEQTVAENIYMGTWPRKKTGLIDWQSIRSKTRNILKTIGVEIDPDTLVSSLPMALRQMVEIAKVLTQDPDIVIFDEPTAALSKDEVDRLHHILQNMKARGKGLVFISHRLDEILRASDIISVMKDGSKVITAEASDFNEEKLIKSMVGRDFAEIFPPKEKSRSQPKELFTLEATLKRFNKKIAFTLCDGEVLGFAGLQGQGQIELLESIFGLPHCSELNIRLEDRPVSVSSTAQAMRSGIALIPENRSEEGVFLLLSVLENLAAASIDKRQRFQFIQKTAEKNAVNSLVEKLSIKITDVKQTAGYLSGGNLQKLVIGKWMIAAPRVMVMLEPTKGVDVATKKQIYTLIRDLAKNNVAIILYSSEMLELIGVCDRVFVMNQGFLTTCLEGDQLTEENIMKGSVSRTNLLETGTGDMHIEESGAAT